MKIQQFFVGGLGHQSYLVIDESRGLAAVVDPRRDVDVYLDAIAHEPRAVRITHVFETHVHNDYISGARELAARTGCQIVTAASAGVAYDHIPARDGDAIEVGDLTFRVLATPGHTPDHLSYALHDRGESRPQAVFTGGSMLSGGAGRTDLVSPGMTLTLTREQYHSIHRLLELFADDVLVYPTHGAGSFCGSTVMDGAPARHSTIGQERLISPVSSVPDEAAFVAMQLANFGAYPAYYAYMGDINARGPEVLGTLPSFAPRSVTEVQQGMRHGVPLIDGRPRAQFAREHVPGSYNIEFDESFATYVGWVLPFNKPLMVLLDDPDVRHDAALQLVRIGYEKLRGYLDGGIAAWRAAGLATGSFEAIDTTELHRRCQAGLPLAVLDVRDGREWHDGHIPGAQHIHVGDLPHSLYAVPAEVPVATICRGGFRASLAASLVAATGRTVVAVQRGGVPDWIAAGYAHEESTRDPSPQLASAPDLHGHA